LYAHASFHGQAQALPTLLFAVYTPLDKFFLMNDAVLVYLFKNFVPLKTSLLYPYPDKMNGFFHFFIYCSPLIVGAMVLFLVKFAVRYRPVVFGGFFFLITIALPVILLWYNAYFISDHYLYLPSIGLFYVLACILDHLLQKKNMTINKICYLLLGGYAVLMSVMTFQYCKAWQNDTTIWSHAIDLYPNAPLTSIAYNNRGHAYQLDNEGDKALSDLSRAIDLSPKYEVAYLNRSLLYIQYRQYALAMKDCLSMLELDPNDVRALNNMGFAYVSSGQYAQGVEFLTKAIKTHPDFSLLYFNRGMAYMNLRQFKEAAQDFHTVMILDPQNTIAISRYQQVLNHE
jgi:tetratricopeptide (TPR) repeat protein